MYTIITVLLVGIATLYSAESKCDNLPAMENFDPLSYFKGTWYYTHSSPNAFTCLGIIAKVSENKGLFQKNSGNSNDLDAYVELDTIPKDSAKFVTHVRVLEKNVTTPQYKEMNTTIIDTDYDNYAIVHYCFDINDGIDTMFVMGRDSDSSKVHPNVEKVLDRLGGKKLSEYYTIDHENCDKDD